MARPLFSNFCVGMEKFLPPHKRKMVGSGHARPHDVAIEKIIDGNLKQCQGTFVEEYFHIFSGQNN